jgi:hypothetical protein
MVGFNHGVISPVESSSTRSCSLGKSTLFRVIIASEDFRMSHSAPHGAGAWQGVARGLASNVGVPGRRGDEEDGGERSQAVSCPLALMRQC